MSERHEAHENLSEAEQNEKILQSKLEAATVAIYGDEATEHLDFMHEELDSAEEYINYLYGALLADGHDPVELLEAVGILETPTDEAE